MMTEVTFKDKTILITGGVEGIGLECAKKLSSLGSRVIVTCKTNKSYEMFKKSDQEYEIEIEKFA